MIPDSAERVNKRLELGGKTEQVQTTGKNLFDTSFAKNKENYKEVTIAGSVIYAIELSLKPNTKYAFQCVIKSVPTTMNVGNSTIRYVVSDGQKRVITTNEDGKLYIGFSRNPDGEIHKIGVSIVDIQVEESTTVTPYEPYTGGKPSPSPEYPQEIKNVGKWNEETQKYEVDVKVTNAEQNWSKEQLLTLTSDRPITKWDRLVEQGGQIGWLYASKKYVITGNEFFEYRSGYDQDAYTNRFIVINDLFVNRLSDKQLAYCKILKRVQYIYAQNKLEEGIDTNVNQLHIKLSNDRIGVLSSDDTETRTAKIAEYIKNTYTDGIEILYATTDTVFLPLPQSEQNAIRALKTYYPTTVITADGGELDPDIKVTYTADTKNYIDNKFGKTINAMQTKLLELESRV